MIRSFLSLLCAVAIVFSAFAVWQNRVLARDAQAAAPPQLLPVHRLPIPPDAQTATFAGGCFWGVEEAFRLVPGVVDTQAGYTGGTSEHPTYQTVHGDKTGHVEAVKVVFDPSRVTYAKLLTVFFAHRSVSVAGNVAPKIGKPYRTFVFAQNAAQEKAVQAMVQQLGAEEAKNAPGEARRLVVGIKPVGVFWQAEEEHQRYYEKRRGESASGAACRL